MKLLYYYFAFLGLCSFSIAQQIDSVLFISNPEFVFTYYPYHHKTATFQITAYDQNGQPVAANSPIAISVLGGILQSPSLFKSEISSDSSWYNYFYFRTDANGQITVDYYPHRFFEYTYWGFKKNYLLQHPTATNDEILNHYKTQYKIDLQVLGVRFQDENDEQTAYWYGVKPFKTASVLPVMYAFNAVVIHGTAEDGSPYIFTAENFKAKPISIEIQALDLFNRPLPAGTALWIESYWGRFYGTAVTHKVEEGTSYYSFPLEYNPSFAGGGSYVVTLGNEGKAKVYYQPPPTTMVPFTNWANTMIAYKKYENLQQAWQAYTSNEFIGNAPGTAVFNKIYGTGRSSRVWTGYANSYELIIDSTKSTLPALVGVDKIKIETETDRNFHYVYASENFSEKATLTVMAYDSYGRLVPKGAPVALMVNTQFTGGNKSIITGANVISAAYAGDDELCFIVRMGENGQTEVEYQAPFIPFRWPYFEGEDGKGQTYDDRYSGIFKFFPLPFFGWSWWGDTLNPPHWFMGYVYGNSSNPFVNILDENQFNSFPVLVGPQQAGVYFHPSTLGPFKYVSKANIYVKDHFGNPAPKGSNVFIAVGSGTLNDNQKDMDAIIYGKNGKTSVAYFSPTRPIWHTWSYGKIQVYQDAVGNLLTEKKIKLVGPAASWHDFKLSNWILGFDLVKSLKQLNPLRAIGALKDFVQYSEDMAKANRQFFDKIFAGTATDADFNAYEQRWQTLSQHIRRLAETIPNTSLTGPDLSAGELFKGLTTSGLRHTIMNTLEDQLIKDPQKKVVKDFLKFHLSKFYSSEGANGQARPVKTNATYSYHIPKKFGKLELRSQLFTLTSTTGMYEMYGFKFRVNELDSVVLKGAINVGDQWPVEGFLIPKRFSTFGYPQEALILSDGFFEITAIDPRRNYIEGITIGYLFNDFQSNPTLAFSKKIGVGGDTLSDVYGGQLIIPENAITDSTHLFMVRSRPPLPLIENDQKIIQIAQNIGSMASDSTIQIIHFSVPAKLKLLDSLNLAQSDPWVAYQFDENTQRWNRINTASYQNDTIFVIPVQSTGIYGIARSGSKQNEYPVVSSFSDTTIGRNQSLSLPFSANDPEGHTITLWATSTKAEVSVSVNDTLLWVTPANDWTGVAEIALWASDGQDTSISSFTIYVVDLTNITKGQAVPQTYQLFQNYPNPFNSNTTIKFNLPKASLVKIEIYNLLGQRVRTLINSLLPAGIYQLRWLGNDDNGRPVGSGMYLLFMRANNFSARKKLVLIK